MPPTFEFDAASVLNKGQRTYQEDAVVIDFDKEADMGLAVLADGMGGHAAGDVASQIVVSEVYKDLKSYKGDADAFEARASDRLHGAAMHANACLKDHAARFPETRGMGATLVASVIIGGNLYWISIGDSPLFLFRDKALVQLNEDHSMATQIDYMVRSGLLAPEAGEHHPDRNTLTSVLFGADVAKIDCPADPVALRDGDILIVASDGLQFLSDHALEAELQIAASKRSHQIADALLQKVLDLKDPNLDNVSFSVIKVCRAARPTEASCDLHPTRELRRAG